VGKPDDFSEGNRDKEETQTCPPDEKTVKKKFFRNPEGKIIGGVCSGISAYFEWDVLAIRIVFIILILATSLWIIPVYLLAWIFFPEAKTAAQKLQMQGKPITVENIGKMVADDIEKSDQKENFDQKEKTGCLGGFIEFVGKTLKGCFFALGCLLTFPALLVIGMIFLLAIVMPFGIGGEISGIFPWYLHGSIPFLNVSNPIPTSISLIILLLIPFIALIYGIISYFAKLKPLNAWIKWTSFSIWIIALVLFLCSGFKVNWKYISEKHFIEGNGILTEKTDTIAPIDHILLENGLVAHLQIEQIPGNYTSILLSGDENLIANVHYRVNNGKLRLFTDNHFYLSRDNNLIIKVQTPSLKKIEPGISGRTYMSKAFICNELEIELSGAGYFQADSLTVQTLKVDLEGSGFVKIAGYARNVKFDLDGAAKVDAWDLLSDTLDAEVNGVGSIRCNPTEYLKGKVNGIGNIKYKNEPKQRNVRVFGLGSIGLE
jgi:phage shock protein PspC (stress-responsive transcriptional regulator)